MGAADPYLFQAYLFLVRRVSGDSRVVVTLFTSFLSLCVPLSWYLFGREVLRSRSTALFFASVACFVPTWWFSYSFFMNETLLLPLLGFSLWATWRAKRTRSPWAFLLAAVLWLMASLTRSIAFPLAALCLLWLVLDQWRRVWPVLGAAAAWAGGFTAAALHSFPHFGTYSPFGNFNKLVLIYFLSGANTYKVHINNQYTYYFSSPSLYISPFYPLPFPTIRTGTYEFAMDAARAGADLSETISQLFWANLHLLPRLALENVVFLSLSHSWPESGGTLAGQLCFGERLIWLPLILTAVLVSVRRLRRPGFDFFSFMTTAFVLLLYAAQLAPTEGRYRRPLEPVVLMACLVAAEAWLAARRPRPPPPHVMETPPVEDGLGDGVDVEEPGGGAPLTPTGA
jgi:hypothetical protein